jgi:hypothetical protein
MSINNLLQPSHKELDGSHNPENINNHDANENALIFTTGYDVKSWKSNIQPFEATKFIETIRAFLLNIMCLKLHINVIDSFTCKL